MHDMTAHTAPKRLLVCLAALACCLLFVLAAPKSALATTSLDTMDADGKTPLTSIAFSKSTVYCTGSEAYPTVTALSGTSIVNRGLTHSSKTLTIEGLHGNVLPGSYTVTVSGKGTITGTVTGTYQIKVKGTSLTKTAAGKKGSLKVSWKTTSSSYATGYQIRYSSKKSMSKVHLLTIDDATTRSATITKLKPHKKYYLQIRTFKTINGKKYVSDWSNVKKAVTR